MSASASKNIDFASLQAAYTSAQGTVGQQTQTQAQLGQQYSLSNSGYCNGNGSYIGGYYAYANPYVVYTGVGLDKTQTAFKLAKKLIDKDLIEIDTVKDFISLIDTIVGVL